MEDWVEIGRIEQIPRRGARCVNTPVGKIAVFRTNEDKVYAIEDRCPHKGGPLSQGLIYGKRVACPLHNWQIDLASGEAQAPDIGCAHHHHARVENGRVMLALRDAG